MSELSENLATMRALKAMGFPPKLAYALAWDPAVVAEVTADLNAVKGV